jgi:glycosyltransferase involved in cell wall biosynthesis
VNNASRAPDEASALFLSPESPYPLAGGGALRSASLLNYLARHYAVDLIVFREPRAEDPRKFLPPHLVRETHVIELPAHARNTWARAARNAGRLARRVPPLIDRFAGFGEQITAATRGRHYDIAVIEHFWCAPYHEQLSTAASTTVLDLHNIESVLHERCASVERGPQGLMHGQFHKICLALEQQWLPKFTHLLAASQADAEQLRRISPASAVSIYANSIPLTPAPVRYEEDIVIFSGNLEYHPNISAVRYFRRQIWPRLRERWPGLIWRIAGKNPQGVARIVSGDPRIDLAGPMREAIPELARAKVAVVPILAGSGTRIKILEAWSAGVPVVSTSLGAEGLAARDGDHLLLADDASSFENAVSRLLSSPGLRAQIARAGRYLLECEFTWEAAWKALQFLDPCYDRMSSDAVRH